MAVVVLFDVISSLILLTCATLFLSISSQSVWALLLTGTASVANTIYQSRSGKGTVKWKKGFTDWFVVLKLVTSLLCVILMNLFRQAGWYTEVTHNIAIIFMIINVLDAVAGEISFGYYANAMVGSGLLLV